MAINEIVPFSQDTVIPDELILDVGKLIGAFATDVVQPIEDPCNDRKACSRGNTLDRPQCSLWAVEYYAAQGMSDLAEESMLDRKPFGDVGRVVRDAQQQTQTAT